MCLVLISMGILSGLTPTSVRAGTGSGPSGYVTIAPTWGKFSGQWVVGDQWGQTGDGHSHTFTSTQVYLKYQGSSTDAPTIKFRVTEVQTTYNYQNICQNGVCYCYTLVSININSVTDKQSISVGTSDPNIAWLAQHPNVPIWYTPPWGPLAISTSASQGLPPNCQGSQTIYWEYVLVDNSGWSWGVGYYNTVDTNKQCPIFGVGGNLGSTCINTLSQDYNWWGGNNWWQFNVANVNNNNPIEMNIRTSYTW